MWTPDERSPGQTERATASASQDPLPHNCSFQFYYEFIWELYIAMMTWLLVVAGSLLLVVGTLAGLVSASRYELLLAISILGELGAIGCFLGAARGKRTSVRGLLLVGILLAALVIVDGLGRLYRL